MIADARDVTIRWGMPVSSAERTWCELASSLGLPDLVAVGDFMLARPLTTDDRLLAGVVRYRGRRGRALMRLALPMIDGRAESRRESLMRVLLHGEGFAVVPNVPITTSEGFNYRGDLVIPESLVVFEYQGEHHTDPVVFANDLRRRARLEADGWVVVFIGVRDFDDPAEFARRLRSILKRQGRLAGA